MLYFWREKRTPISQGDNTLDLEAKKSLVSYRVALESCSCVVNKDSVLKVFKGVKPSMALNKSFTLVSGYIG